MGATIYNAQEFWKFNCSCTIIVDIIDHLLNFISVVCKTKTYERVLQLVDTDVTTTVLIQTIEALS